MPPIDERKVDRVIRLLNQAEAWLRNAKFLARQPDEPTIQLDVSEYASSPPQLRLPKPKIHSG